MIYTAAVITISDKGSQGLREDTSGPALCAMLREAGWEIVHTAMIPDEAGEIKAQLCHCADTLAASLVLTTGGTGFSPRDITPEATLAVIDREVPGIAEAMRAASMAITPRGCLSRGRAGIRGTTLIVNLPGSEKAARENLAVVLEPLRHGIDILHSVGSADCGQPVPSEARVRHAAPSMDAWLKEAKSAPEADQVGMYLTHSGVVRATARSAVRQGDTEAAPVTGMDFSYDREKVAQAVEQTRSLPGIHYVRVWLNEGHLEVGDDIMRVLIGGDIRPHTVDALQFLVSTIKNQCVTEQERH